MSRRNLQYLPALDGLRAVAVSLVLVHHLNVGGFTGWAHGNQGIGVDIFFVISGYLITHLILDQILDKTFKLKTFYLRRAIRLMPAACIVIAAVALATWAGLIAEPSGPVSWWRSCFAALTYHMNILQSAKSTHHIWALTHTWSLSLEEQFYVFWPLLILGVRKLSPLRFQRNMGITCGAIMALSLGWRAFLTDHGLVDWVYNGTDSRATQLAIGGLMACIPEGLSFLKRAGHLSLLAAPLLAVIALVKSPTFLGVLTFEAVGLLTAAVLLGLITQQPLLTRVLQFPFLVQIGKRSYALYLVHYPVFFAINRGAFGGVLVTQAVRLLLTVALAEILHRVIEAPCIAWGKRRFQRGAPALVSVSV
jgi:peptidoglycan/LPS O-acetylase OafA/YrhL